MRHWVRQSRGDSQGDADIVEEMINYGAPQHVIDAFGNDAQKKLDFYVMSENMQSIKLFLLCSKQWKVAPMGGIIGFDFCAIKVVLEFANFTMTPDLFQDLRVIESTAIEAFADEQ